MRVFYGKGSYKRGQGNLPELKCVNMHVEKSPVDEEGVILQSRKGLKALNPDPAAGPIAGIHREDGVFEGDTFVVSGGSGLVSFAASATELGICVDGLIHRYDGSTTEVVDFPDDQRVRKILYHDGLFFAIPYGGDSFYASDVLDLATWNALSFKSAESAPDELLDAETFLDGLILFGSATTEPWDNDDSGATVPYTRRESSIFDIGIKATGCCTKVDQGVFFVSNDNRLMVTRGQSPERVSDHAMEERIAASNSCKVDSYQDDGHAFVRMRLDTGTWALDVATGEFREEATNGLPNMLGQCVTRAIDGPPTFGGSDGKLYKFGGWTDGTYPLERRFTAGVPMNGGVLNVDVVSLTANTGWADEYTDDPIVEFRSSRDGGANFGTWRQCSLGARGEHRNRVRFRRVGMFDEPGALFEFRTVGPWGFRVSGVMVNEQGGGRSR